MPKFGIGPSALSMYIPDVHVYMPYLGLNDVGRWPHHVKQSSTLTMNKVNYALRFYICCEFIVGQHKAAAFGFCLAVTTFGLEPVLYLCILS